MITATGQDLYLTFLTTLQCGLKCLQMAKSQEVWSQQLLNLDHNIQEE